MFEDMGAYTISLVSTQNEFPLPKVFSVVNQEIWLVSFNFGIFVMWSFF